MNISKRATQQLFEDESYIERRPLGRVEPSEPPWLWRPYIPAAGVVMLDGDVGVGKSTLAAWLAAGVTTGRLPGGDGVGRRVLVALPNCWRTEELVSRLAAHGADRDQVLLVSTVTTPDGAMSLMLDRHVQALSTFVSLEEVRLIVVDPLILYAGSVNLNNLRGAVQLMAKLRQLALATWCCVLLVRHLDKSGGGRRALARGNGCAALLGEAHVGLIMISDPDRGADRYVATIKNSLAPLGPTLRFALPGAHLELQGTVPESADDLLLADASRNLNLVRDAAAAARFLARLVNAPMKCAEVKRVLVEKGYGPRAVRYGLVQSGVRAIKQGEEWLYMPPPPEATDVTAFTVQDDKTPTFSPQTACG